MDANLDSGSYKIRSASCWEYITFTAILLAVEKGAVIKGYKITIPKISSFNCD